MLDFSAWNKETEERSFCGEQTSVFLVFILSVFGIYLSVPMRI